MQNRYDYTTRIGNWYEDMVLEDEKMREFLEKKAAGTLTIQRIRQNLNLVHLPPPSDDGLLHYNTPVRIFNAELNCFIACDPGDAENDEEQLYSATGSRMDDITARNVWVIKKCDNSGRPIDEGNKEPVCYGDEFLISSTDSLADRPFYLSSHHFDWTHFSRVSRKQLVCSQQKETYENAWRVESCGRDTMMDFEGEPVHIDSPVLLKHVQTNAPLYVNEATFLNDYGSEFELTAGKTQGRKLVWQFQEN